MNASEVMDCMTQLLIYTPSAEDITIKGRKAGEISCSILRSQADKLPPGWSWQASQQQAPEGRVMIIRKAEGMLRPVRFKP